MADQQVWKITKGQQRMVVALVHQRQEVIAGANKTLAEIEEALQETLKLLATPLGLDAAKVEFADGETPGEILLREKSTPPMNEPGKAA